MALPEVLTHQDKLLTVRSTAGKFLEGLLHPGIWAYVRCETGAVDYVRRLAIRMPRWSSYDAMRANFPLLPGVAATVQERAWMSPIGYTPG